MANNCWYNMKLVGNKEDCLEWLERMCDYEKPKHFFRIFSAEVYEEYMDEDTYVCFISGDCAWSIEVCCRGSEWGYSGGRDLFAENTAELHLKMEVWSEEPGIGFQEHYIYDNGDCVEEACLDYNKFYWDKSEYETYRKLCADYPDAPPEEAFDEYGEARIRGFRNYLEWTIEG